VDVRRSVTLSYLYKSFHPVISPSCVRLDVSQNRRRPPNHPCKGPFRTIDFVTSVATFNHDQPSTERYVIWSHTIAVHSLTFDPRRHGGRDRVHVVVLRRFGFLRDGYHELWSVLTSCCRSVSCQLIDGYTLGKTGRGQETVNSSSRFRLRAVMLSCRRCLLWTFPRKSGCDREDRWQYRDSLKIPSDYSAESKSASACSIGIASSFEGP
jgi:hypothetical protein